MKEADFTVIPLIGPKKQRLAAFPSVVMESGRYEPRARLQADAELWQKGSAGAVRVVLQVIYYGADCYDHVGVDLLISRTAPGRGPASLEHYASVFIYSMLSSSLLTSQLCVQPIIPAPPQQQYPSISLDEFYAGNCPPTMNPKTQIPLDLEMLRQAVAVCARKRGAPPP